MDVSIDGQVCTTTVDEVFKNPYTVAFDVPFGCPGWLHAVIMADYYIKSGDAKRILIIGSEILWGLGNPRRVKLQGLLFNLRVCL